VRRRWALATLAGLVGCRAEVPATPHARAPVPIPVAVKPFRMARPDVVLLVTGGTNGMLEVCNCRGPMPGGLARRSGLVRSYRAAFGNTLLIDTGDAFWVEPNDLRNEFLLKGYAQIGYDAVVLGDQEWAADSRRLARLQAATGLTYLSTNVSADGVETVPLVRREVGGTRVAILSDVPRDSFHFVPGERVAQLGMSGSAAVGDRIAELKKAGFLVVLVAHMGSEALEACAPASAADLILRGHTTRSEPKLLRIGGKPVVKVGGSETVGAVALKVRDGRIAEMDYRVEVVDTSWPLDKRLIQTYQAYAHAAMRRALDAERKAGLQYVSSAECGRCHRAPYAAWKAGPHARAYKTLQRVRRTGDPNCLMCHTSGFGTKQGFRTFAKTPRLAGVNCQDCHRFNEPEHHRKGFRFPPVSKDVCTTCHTPVTDPKFQYGKRLPKVRCPPARAASAERNSS